MNVGSGTVAAGGDITLSAGESTTATGGGIMISSGLEAQQAVVLSLFVARTQVQVVQVALLFYRAA